MKPGTTPLPNPIDDEEGYTKLKRPEVNDYYGDDANDEDYDEEELYDEDGQEDNQEASGGYYRDGVYAAAPIIGPQRPSAAHLADLDPSTSQTTPHQPTLLEADDAHHSSLLRRFRSHKASLGTTAATQTTTLGLKTWRTRLVSSPPTREQAANMDYTTLWRCLGLGARLLQRRGRFSARQMKILGAWLWCLFAKIEDIVTLSSEEVAAVREVGKAAIEVIRRRIMNEEDDDVDEDEEDEDEEDGVEDKVDVEDHDNYAEEHVEYPDPNDDMISHPQLSRRNTSSDEEGEDNHSALQAARARLLKTIHTPTSTTAEQTSAPSIQPSTTSKAASELKSTAAPDSKASAAFELKDPTAAAVSKSKQITPPTTETETETETEEDVQEAEEQMNAVLDMVLTIVGEEFGQRDLLVARDVLWSNAGNDKA